MRTARRSTTPKNTQAAGGITYARPSSGDSVAIVDVGLGRTDREDENADDLVVRDDELVDFLIAVDDLVFDGERVTPADGDRITMIAQHDDGDPHAATGTAHGETLIYVVARTRAGEMAWRFADPTRSTYRVHTKLVSETDAEIAWP